MAPYNQVKGTGAEHDCREPRLYGASVKNCIWGAIVRQLGWRSKDWTEIYGAMVRQLGGCGKDGGRDYTEPVHS